MVNLKHYQWDQVREWFCPSPGYVLDFSNRTFKEFFDDHFDTNIYADTFSKDGTSKFHRLRSFIEIAPSHTVIELLNLLWARLNLERDEQLERLNRGYDDDTYGVDYIQAMYESAASENEPYEQLISEIATANDNHAASQLRSKSEEWNLDTLNREIDRAIKNIELDPEASVTAACSMLEAVCRSIIIGRGIELPKKMDIQTLSKAAREPLGLSPDKDVAIDHIESDIRTTLAGLANVIQGIGALRSHAGSAHGHERGFRRIDARIARLSVYAAFAVALFFVETWERKFPEDRLLSVS